MTAASKSGISVLMIGGGNMGAAIAQAVESRLPDAHITIVDPNVDKVRQLLPETTEISVHPTCAVIPFEQFDIGIVAVKPQHVEEALLAAASNLNDSLTISIAAGIPLEKIRNAARHAGRFVRVMPNLAAMASRSMSVGYAQPDSISLADRENVETLFGAVGHYRWLNSEHEIDLATGVTGSGPGYVFSFVEHLQKGAEAIGFSKELAEEFARQTIIGAAHLLEHDPRSAHDLKVAVTSPEGTTAAGLAILEAPTALPKILHATVAAAAARAKQLAETQ